ncbi:MAG: VWA domain-containing protein [Symploca sp. SIO1A3]|nr:VWA domain-containing protein [Symploca sp. SIO1A3]
MLNIQFKPHRASIKANTPDPQKVYVMLKLIPELEVAKTRPPLAYALVIDTSGSMYDPGSQAGKTKLDQAIDAAHTLIDDSHLESDDLITVIHFDDNSRTLLPLTPLYKKPAIHQAVDSLRKYSGATYMGKGMKRALTALADVSPQTAKRVFLLTDGETFDEPKCEALASEFSQSNTPLITIGFGVEYNEDLLIRLANDTQGKPYHLSNMADLQRDFGTEVKSSVKEVVTDLCLSVATVKGVTLSSVMRVYSKIAEANLSTQPYRLGNIEAGDFTVFILEFTIADIARPPSRVRIAQVGLVGHAPALGRRDEFPVQNLFINFTTDEAEMAAVDEEVLGYVQQKNVDRMVQDAMRLATKDPRRAQQTLQAATGMTKRLGNPGMTKMLDNALGELNKTGTISPNTVKTVRAGGRTKTIKPGGATKSMEGGLSQDEIRRLTGA